jgi:membrane-associated phospholipid phosphatase
MRADNFLFASSLVLSFSSSVLGIPGSFGFPSGHNSFLKASMKVIARASSKRALTVSLIFLMELVRNAL